MTWVAVPVPVTEGTPYSRHTMAAWEVIPPMSVTAALILENTGAQAGLVFGTTMMSSCSKVTISSSSLSTRALPSTQPADDANPFSSFRSPDLVDAPSSQSWTRSVVTPQSMTVNGSATTSGGTHENGFKRAVVDAVKNFMGTHDIKVKGLDITAADIREGIVGVLSVFVRDPMFQGQTKERLNNPEMTANVESFVRPAFEAWLNANMTAADQIVGRTRPEGTGSTSSNRPPDGGSWGWRSTRPMRTR